MTKARRSVREMRRAVIKRVANLNWTNLDTSSVLAMRNGCNLCIHEDGNGWVPCERTIRTLKAGRPKLMTREGCKRWVEDALIALMCKDDELVGYVTEGRVTR